MFIASCFHHKDSICMVSYRGGMSQLLRVRSSSGHQSIQIKPDHIYQIFSAIPDRSEHRLGISRVLYHLLHDNDPSE
jgi:hypothetical protein